MEHYKGLGSQWPEGEMLIYEEGAGHFRANPGVWKLK